jgi:hypothetical protein
VPAVCLPGQDENLRRGTPLFLNERRYEALQAMW